MTTRSLPTSPNPASPLPPRWSADSSPNRRPGRISFATADRDERWFERLDVDSAYEVWLISWLPGQGTGLHDHGEALGAFAVAEGTLTETAVRAGPLQSSDLRLRSGSVVQTVRRKYGAGQVRGFGHDHVHEVANLDDAPAVSLHAYAPKLTAMTQYVLEDSRLRVVASERVGVDW